MEVFSNVVTVVYESCGVDWCRCVDENAEEVGVHPLLPKTAQGVISLSCGHWLHVICFEVQGRCPLCKEPTTQRWFSVYSPGTHNMLCDMSEETNGPIGRGIMGDVVKSTNMIAADGRSGRHPHAESGAVYNHGYVNISDIQIVCIFKR